MTADTLLGFFVVVVLTLYIVYVSVKYFLMFSFIPPVSSFPPPVLSELCIIPGT